MHWPYCARICPYCDFNIYKNRGVDEARWRAAFDQELAGWALRAPNRLVTSIYFGGGTPSLAPISVIAGVIDRCRRLWPVSADAEITLEANPTDAELSRFADYKAAGVTRLSLGVQSLDDDALAFLGRNHDAKSARRGIKAALTLFDYVNIDLIYARPGQALTAWRRELAEAIDIGARHISAYQLTIEPGTAFDRAVAKNRWSPPEDDLCADFYDLTQEVAAAAGMPAYEISNHAAPGHESHHNLAYWRQQDYVGAGPGAHGRLTIENRRHAFVGAMRPEDWLARVEQDGFGAAQMECLSDDAAMIEKYAMGLRTIDGVAMTPTEAARLAPAIDQLAGDGVLQRRGMRLVASENGRRLLDTVLAQLLAD
ncbi:MAG: radical SAM family heme chaperone HemW [Parvularculaceae bacterium]|nr:radical SAM family heme chaperone HemW [Parvularculaceae bacterium]